MKNVLSFLIVIILGFNAFAQELNYNVFLTQPSLIAEELTHGRAQFGPTLIHNIEGEAIWAYSQIDSLACDSVITNLTNKIALIRRGACNFSLKVYHAQKAGAIGVIIVNNIPGNGIFGMTPALMADSVNIPSAMISYEKGAELDSLILAGESVSIKFNSVSIKTIKPHYAKKVPLLLARKWTGFAYSGKNSNSIPVTSSLYFELRSPTNSIISFGNIPVNYDANSYSERLATLSLPPNFNEIGEHTLRLVSALEPMDTITETFEITDGLYTYSSVDTFERTASASSSFFENPNILGSSHTLYVGSELKTSELSSLENTRFSSDSVMVSFGIYNENQLVGRNFEIEIYEKPDTGYGANPNLLTSIASADYTIQAEDTMVKTDFIKVKMKSSQYTSYNAPENRIVFKQGTDYLVMVKYQGSTTYPTQPLFFHTNENILSQTNTVLFYNTLYPNGWTDESVQTQILIEFEGCLDYNVHNFNPSVCEGDLLNVNDSLYAPLSTVFQVIEGDGLGICDSVLIGVINELENSDTTFVTDTICSNEFYPIGSSLYFTTGIHSNTLVNSDGCDSVVVVDLTVNTISTTDLIEQICQGEIFEVGSSIYNTTGNYIDTFTNQYGCDSIVNLDLTVNPVSETQLTEMICQGETFEVGGSSYNATGNYTDTLTNQYDCDSIIDLNLTVNLPSETQLTEMICQGEIFEVGSSIYNTTGNYIDTLSNQYGCDSIVDLNLTVNPVSETQLTEMICQNDEFVVGGSSYNATGNYIDTLTNQYGCDSIVNLDLTVNPVSETQLTEMICQGEIFEVGSSSYNATGNYSDTLQNQYGCDSVINLNLTVNPVSETQLTEMICQGEIFEVGSSIYNTTGNYTDTLQNQYGCDSIVDLNLTVNLPSETQLTEMICQGEIFEVGSSIYNTTGNHSDTLQNQYGCDSIVILELTVNPVSETQLTEMICQGEIFEVGSLIYNTTGNYTDTLTNQYGCDSIVDLNLTVNLPSETQLTEMICQGEIFEVGSSIYNTTGNYTDTLTNQNGCDSIVELNLTVNLPSETQLTEMICQGEIFEVGSSIYNTTGNYMDTLTNQNGCDSIVELNLTVNLPSETQLTEMLCQGEIFEVGSSIYNTTGNYIDTLQNQNGCDSIVELNLTVEFIDLTVSVNGVILESNQNNASYQWLSCPDFSPIIGAEDQTYSGTDNGFYAVEISFMNCVDTSECLEIQGIGLTELSNSFYSVHPNPFIDKIEVDFNDIETKGHFELINNIGQVIKSEQFENHDLIIYTEKLPKGSYYLVLNVNDKLRTLKMIK